MIEVERFDISQVPDHGRPRVMELRGKPGVLGLHCKRDDGSLWLFAVGPAGGDRGEVVVPVRYAPQLAAWLDGEARGAMPSTMGVLYLDPPDHWPSYRTWPDGAERMLVVRKRAGLSSKWEMPLDAAATDKLLTALREWEEACVRMGAA